MGAIEKQESAILAEAARVTRRVLIVKDHKLEGPLAYWRTCFLDWAANSPYHVTCLYRFHTLPEWRKMFAELGLRPIQEELSINLFPPIFNLVFGRRLQYWAVVESIGRPSV